MSTERGRFPGAVRVVATAFAAVACLLAFGCGGGDDVATDGGVGGDAPDVSAGDSAAGTHADERLPVLLDLGADKCVPCKMMAPILEEMRETFAGRLDVRFIDVWKDGAAARKYDVKVIPTQIFFDADGNELFRHQGFFSREDMLAKWGELGYDFSE